MNPQNEIKHLKNFNNSLAVKVDECLQEISTLRARLQEAEWIVGNVYEFPIGSDGFLEWMTRRDAWLKGVKS